MGSYTINIDYDGTNISADPDSLVIKAKGTANITWALRNVPAGTKFHSTDGIAFKANNPHAWPGTPPSPQSDTRYTSSEDVQESNRGKYNYNITIVLPGGAEKKQDPDVSNDPPSGPPMQDELPEQAKGDPPRGPMSGGGKG